MNRIVFWCAFACAAHALAGGAVLSGVTDAEVGMCCDGVVVFNDREYQMTSDAAKRLAGKTFFRRTIGGDFFAEVMKGGELFVVTPTEKAGKFLSQGKTLAALGFEKVIVKNGLLIAVFIANPMSPYYKSQTFATILEKTAEMPRYELKQVENKLKIVVRNVPSLKEARAVLSKLR